MDILIPKHVIEDQELSHLSKIVYGFILYKSKNVPRVEISNIEFCTNLYLSYQSIYKCLNSLNSLGYITIEKGEGRKFKYYTLLK